MNRSSKRLREGVNLSVKGVGCVPVPIVSMGGFRGTTKEKRKKKTTPKLFPSYLYDMENEHVIFKMVRKFQIF